jgi:ketosteroid isomerase-like protein
MANNDKKIMKEIVEQYYRGNFQVIIDNITENVNWTSHKMANVQLKSKKEVVDFLDNVPVGRFLFENSKFIIDKNNVVVEGICRYKNKDGKLIENFYCDIFTFSDNKIEKVSSYFI